MPRLICATVKTLKRKIIPLRLVIVSLLVFTLGGPISGRAANPEPSILTKLEVATTHASKFEQTLAPDGAPKSRQSERQRPRMGPMGRGRVPAMDTQGMSARSGRSGIDMRGMMDAMRRPLSTETFPDLMSLGDPSTEDFARIERAATVRMSRGAGPACKKRGGPLGRRARRRRGGIGRGGGGDTRRSVAIREWIGGPQRTCSWCIAIDRRTRLVQDRAWNGCTSRNRIA